MSRTENWPPGHLGSQHWSVLLVQSCQAALPTGFCFKGRAVIPCFPSAGSEQLQPRGHRRLQAAGSQRALGGRGLHHHWPHHWHLLRGSLHNGEQGPSALSAGPPEQDTTATATCLYLFRDACMLSKRIFHILHFRNFCCLWLNTSNPVLAAVGFLETLAAPICFSSFGQLLFDFSPLRIHHLSDQVTWDL